MDKLLKGILFLLSAVFTQDVLAGVLVNKVDINTITTPEKSVIFVENFDYDNMMLIMQNGEIEVYHMPSEGANYAQDMKDGFKNMQHNKKKFSQYSSFNQLLFNSLNVSFEHAYLKGSKSIILNASESLALCDVSLESPNVFFVGDMIEISNCFIDGNSVHLESHNKKSLVSIIKFTFRDKKELRIPTTVAADIQFKGNDTEIFCVATGVSKVEIEFLPEAFIYTH